MLVLAMEFSRGAQRTGWGSSDLRKQGQDPTGRAGGRRLGRAIGTAAEGTRRPSTAKGGAKGRSLKTE
jgi:hypothetical protein